MEISINCGHARSIQAGSPDVITDLQLMCSQPCYSHVSSNIEHGKIATCLHNTQFTVYFKFSTSFYTEYQSKQDVIAKRAIDNVYMPTCSFAFRRDFL